jgi:hypothetical protein
MNPIEIEQDIQDLELMLHGGGRLRSGAVFGRNESTHYEVARTRAPEVYLSPHSDRQPPDLVIETYNLSEGTILPKSSP